MTSGQAVKYKGSIDCAIQILKHEGFMSMMKGAGKIFGVINFKKFCTKKGHRMMMKGARIRVMNIFCLQS